MSRQLDTVIAALRYWQRVGAEISEIAPDPMTDTEIDEFIETLNTEGIIVTVQGGVVQDVNTLGLPVTVHDYDCESSDENTQRDGDNYAYVRIEF